MDADVGLLQSFVLQTPADHDSELVLNSSWVIKLFSTSDVIALVIIVTVVFKR